MTAWKGVERGEVLARTCDATAEGARKQLGGSRLRTAKKLGASRPAHRDESWADNGRARPW